MIALADDSRALRGAAMRASHALTEHRRRPVAPILIVVKTDAARLL
jgi:hypothetical protein